MTASDRSFCRLMRCALLQCALTLAAASSALDAAPAEAAGHGDPFLRSSFYGPIVSDAGVETAQYDAQSNSLAQSELFQSGDPSALETQQADVDVTLAGYGPTTGYGDVNVFREGGFDGYDCQACGDYWQLLPDGLIYRSYWAGPREPRIGTQYVSTSNIIGDNQNLWDGTVGGRRGLFRYGTGDPLRPQGWQLDIEGAAMVRLNLDNERDVDASDFRFGIPLTYGAGPVQYKFGYYHLSSHLGDEFINRTGSTDRLNYVRDAIIFGISYNPAPAWRIYGETAYAFFTAGGAEPWEFQFGLQYAQPGPTGFCGVPFFATNAHLREELNFGGDWNTQIGWLWRGSSGSTLRTGLQYMNGKSTQYQFYSSHEEQIGVGIWYDF